MGSGHPNTGTQLGLFATAHHCLELADPQAKLAATAAAAKAFSQNQLVLNRDDDRPLAITVPGRPQRPNLVAPRNVPRRGLGTPDGRAALIHAIAHIEFNAINLAWDAVYRFRDMPQAYYADWVGVAADEARHFALLQARLLQLGFAYGDFDAHNGLWEMAVKTADSCLLRMALVPRVLEARGLDVTPGLIARLRSVGDLASIEILEIILREEVAHVAAGSRWFTWCCAREQRDPQTTFALAIATHVSGALRGPFNTAARLAAGFSHAELDALETGT